MLAWSTPGCTAVPLTTVHHYSEPHTALACAVMGSRFGRSCTTVWPAFVKRSRSSARLPDTFMPSFRSSSRSLRTLITGKFACLCSPVSIYTGQGKAGSCQNFAREAALSMGGETRLSSRKFPAVWLKKKGACGFSGERGRRARNWYSEFRAWGAWQGNRGRGSEFRELRGDAPSMWPHREKEGVHEIGTANFVLGGGPGQGTGGARTKLAQRISCFRLPPCVGMLLRGGRRARNWHSEFRAQRSSWPERGAAWGCS